MVRPSRQAPRRLRLGPRNRLPLRKRNLRSRNPELARPKTDARVDSLTPCHRRLQTPPQKCSLSPEQHAKSFSGRRKCPTVAASFKPPLVPQPLWPCLAGHAQQPPPTSTPSSRKSTSATTSPSNACKPGFTSPPSPRKIAA